MPILASLALGFILDSIGIFYILEVKKLVTFPELDQLIYASLTTKYILERTLKPILASLALGFILDSMGIF